MTNRDNLSQLVGSNSCPPVLTARIVAEELYENSSHAALKAAERAINKSSLRFSPLNNSLLVDEHDRPAKHLVLNQLLSRARRKRELILFLQMLISKNGQQYLAFNDARGGRRWIQLEPDRSGLEAIKGALTKLCIFENKNIVVIPSGQVVGLLRLLVKHCRGRKVVDEDAGKLVIGLQVYSQGYAEIFPTANTSQQILPPGKLTHLDRLEAESIHIIREAMAEAENPVMLYSLGKDSSVMLHLVRKAFYPSAVPFPLLHIDTRWKFQAMYDFRDYMANDSDINLLVHVNPEGVAKNIDPFIHGSAIHTNIMKTESLKQALDQYKFDVAFGGARRDEEKSLAKERIFSFRAASHRWDPKNQRPELWNLYNGIKNKDETIRVFPILKWTELDIWQYIYREHIPIVPLYLATERPVIERDGMLMMVDDDRLPLYPGETIYTKKIRFRSLGCYPLTGAIESEADDVASIILELSDARSSERQGRAIDIDSKASMEKKKHKGYF